MYTYVNVELVNMLEVLQVLFESLVDSIRRDKINDDMIDVGRMQRPQEDEDAQLDVLTQHQTRITIVTLSLEPLDDAARQIQSRFII